ncbi:MAG: endonuclease domain-containing protein [Solirubrobacteraceae bacterium]
MSRSPSPDARAQAIADGQHGVLTLAQAGDAGIRVGAVAHRVATGRWSRVQRGVCRIGPPRPGRDGPWMAATLACGPGTALIDASAGALQALLRGDGALVCVAVPGRGGRRTRDGIRVRRVRLLDFETEIVEGIPTTTCSRSLLDLAAGASVARVNRLIARAEQLRRYDHALVLASLLAHPNHPGRRTLVQALESYAEPVANRTTLERAMEAICARIGAPRPRVGTIVAGHECDFYWPDHRLIVETDGWQTHGTRQRFCDDRLRDAEHVARGLRVVRLTYDRVIDEPRAVEALLLRLLDAPGTAGRSSVSA